MSQPLNPYQSPREADDQAGEGNDVSFSGEALQALVHEAGLMEPWLLVFAILTGFPAGVIITGSLAAFGISGCLALLPTGALLIFMIAAVRMRYAAKALGRKASALHLLEFVDATTFLIVYVAAALLLFVVLTGLGLALG